MQGVTLFAPEHHEPLAAPPWDESRARAGISELVRDAERAFTPEALWPKHPLDGDLRAAPSAKSLWAGAAGMLLGLDYLQREGAVELERSYASAAAALHASYLEEPDRGPVVPGLLSGEVGVLLAAWRLAREARAAELLAERVRGNIENPQHELFHGAPGTMLAALHLWEETGEERLRDLVRDNVDYLWSQWRRDPEHGCHLWIQYRGGRLIRSIGAGHGFASNVHSLLRSGELLDDARREELNRRAAETAGTLAVWEDGLPNWPTSADPYWAAEQPIRVQWCHGAPGLVTSLAGLARTPETDALLAAAGELVWRAGPLAKGPGLCHGTAGNGFAFLALANRTGDDAWLERARIFAMHALGQVERARAELGRGRYSLWTGDLGVAVYLWQCLSGWQGIPVLDVL